MRNLEMFPPKHWINKNINSSCQFRLLFFLTWFKCHTFYLSSKVCSPATWYVYGSSFDLKRIIFKNNHNIWEQREIWVSYRIVSQRYAPRRPPPPPKKTTQNSNPQQTRALSQSSWLVCKITAKLIRRKLQWY